jgi:TRAP transporter TAXI family solute receptor
MKKALVLVLVMLMFAGTAWSAERLTLATGGTAGTYYPYGGAIAQIVSEKTGIVEITAQATGATGENLNLLAEEDVDMALVQNDLSYYAYNGLEIFKDSPVKNVRGIARLYPEVIHVVAQANSGIKTIADFKGKRISLGASGSGNEANCRQIFEFYNLDPEYKDLTPYFISYAETTDHFKDLQIDAFVYTTGVPSPSIMDITLLQEAVFVPIDGEVRDNIIQKYPFFTAETLAAGSYKGLDSDLGTVAVQCILVVSDALSEDTVYAMTKALFENLEELGNAHAKGKEVLLGRATEGVTVPLHPGAEKFYRELGLVK